MSSRYDRRHRGEIRLLRALTQAAETDLAAAFARKDRDAVRRFEKEAQQLRLHIEQLSVQADGLPTAI